MQLQSRWRGCFPRNKRPITNVRNLVHNQRVFVWVLNLAQKNIEFNNTVLQQNNLLDQTRRNEYVDLEEYEHGMLEHRSNCIPSRTASFY